METFLDNYANTHRTEAEAVANAVESFELFWFYFNGGRDPRDVLRDFAFGIDNRLPPKGDVRGKMMLLVQKCPFYKEIELKDRFIEYEDAVLRIKGLTQEEYEGLKRCEYLRVHQGTGARTLLKDTGSQRKEDAFVYRWWSIRGYCDVDYLQSNNCLAHKFINGKYLRLWGKRTILFGPGGSTFKLCPYERTRTKYIRGD